MIESTYRFNGNAFEAHSTVLAFTEVPVIGGLIFYTVASIAFAAVMSQGYARAQRLLDERLHLHTWRLRQLVPAPASPAS